jgi:hypothetical protein
VSCFVRNGKRVTGAALLDKPALAPARANGRDCLGNAGRLVADYTVFPAAMRRSFLGHVRAAFFLDGKIAASDIRPTFDVSGKF